MIVKINPKISELGITKTKHELYINSKGKLNVIFRYKNKKLKNFVNGYQVQVETIEENEFRGNHYHYPDFAGEEFYLLSGKAVLFASNLDNSIVELYLLEEHITYYVPAFVAHKIENINHLFQKSGPVHLIIAKHYNYSIENLQKPHNIPVKIDPEIFKKLQNIK